jgi:hypothetical protein
MKRYLLIGMTLITSNAIAEEHVVTFKSHNQVTLVDADTIKTAKNSVTLGSVILRSKESMIGMPKENPKVYILYSETTEEVDCKKKRIRSLRVTAFGPDDVQIFSDKSDNTKAEWIDASEGNTSGNSIYNFICNQQTSGIQYRSYGKMPFKDVLSSIYSKPWP